MKRIKLGQVTAPVGIKGELRVYPYTDTTRFSAVREVLLGDETSPRKVTRVRPDKNLLVIKLEGLDDRNFAETCRNKFIWLPEGQPWEMEEDTYFIEDLIGTAVMDEEGTLLGHVSAVIRNPGQDLYEVKKQGEGSFLLPAVKEFIKAVDPEKKEMTVHLIEGLTEL